MIGNFPATKHYNPGGYRSFYFVPLSEVISFPIIKNGAALLPIGFAPLSGWHKGYSTYATLQLTEESESIDAGEFFKPILNGFYPGDSSEIRNFINEMERYRYFLILATDARGMNVLLGTPGSPMIFTAKYDSGQGRSDSSGYSFQFAGTALDRAPTYPF